PPHPLIRDSLGRRGQTYLPRMARVAWDLTCCQGSLRARRLHPRSRVELRISIRGIFIPNTPAEAAEAHQYSALASCPGIRGFPLLQMSNNRAVLSARPREEAHPRTTRGLLSKIEHQQAGRTQGL